MSAIIEKISKACGFQKQGREMDTHAMVLMAVGLLIVAAPLELGQLAFAFVGALCYAAMQSSRKVAQKTLKKPAKMSKLDDDDYKLKPQPQTTQASRVKSVGASSAGRSTKREQNPAGRQEYRQESAQPVTAASFVASNFDAQVQELLGQISPSPEGDRLVQDIVAAVKTGLKHFIPEAEVMGFASGDVLRGTAFAVAIPEVDIILSASPSVFVERLTNRASRPLPHAAKLDASKLQKAMLRACADELTAVPGFKFRRSAFKGREPKVTLIAEVNGKSIPIDFSVNTVTPLHNAALLTECGQIEPKAKELILLVRRWAKDRGISHAAKGHLSPYAWSLLAIYFLQVYGEQPLLPTVNSFKKASSLLRREQQTSTSAAHGKQTDTDGTSVAALFKEFVRFYKSTFNWRNEAVSVRAGKRQAPAMALPLQIVTLENGQSDVAISVEDPFEPKRNLSDNMTGVTVRRLREELDRVCNLTARDISLSEVIEPWVPPQQEAVGKKADDVDSDE